MLTDIDSIEHFNVSKNEIMRNYEIFRRFIYVYNFLNSISLSFSLIIMNFNFSKALNIWKFWKHVDLYHGVPFKSNNGLRHLWYPEKCASMHVSGQKGLLICCVHFSYFVDFFCSEKSEGESSIRLYVT